MCRPDPVAGCLQTPKCLWQFCRLVNRFLTLAYAWCWWSNKSWRVTREMMLMLLISPSTSSLLRFDFADTVPCVYAHSLLQWSHWTGLSLSIIGLLTVGALLPLCQLFSQCKMARFAGFHSGAWVRFWGRRLRRQKSRTMTPAALLEGIYSHGCNFYSRGTVKPQHEIEPCGYPSLCTGTNSATI